VPNSLNFFAAIGVITFIGNWNAFIWPVGHRAERLDLDGSGGLVHLYHPQTINLS